MEYGNAASAPSLHRRKWSRLTTDLPARATTLFEIRHGTLLDLSLGGAKVFLPARPFTREVPRLVGEVLIEWCGFESLGRAVWQMTTRAGACAGVQFHPDLLPAAIIATRDRQDLMQAQGGPEMVLRYRAREWIEGG